jgi:flagellar hook assembly protein FlgD
MIKKLSLALYLFVPVLLFAQTKNGLGTWKVHLPYWQNKTVAALGRTVFVGSPSSLFSYNEEEKELNRISKINGLSDVEIKLLRSNQSNNLLFIVYENGNIDLYQNEEITNMPQILQRTVIGKKAVNDVTFYNGKAYLACSFGIVVIDVNKKQITDSYQNIGKNGVNIEVTDIAILNNTIYASTLNGIYSAQLNSGNLSDFNFWTFFKSSFKSNKIEAFNNILFAEIDSSLYKFENNTWTNLNDSDLNNPLDLVICNNKLVITSVNNVSVIDKNNQTTKTGKRLKNAAVLLPNDRFACVDNFSGIHLFPGGEFNGSDFIYPNGPYNKITTDFKFINNKLFAAGGYAPFYNEGFNQNGIYVYENNVWRNTRRDFNGEIFTPDSIVDMLNLAYDNLNEKIYAASYGKGLIKMNSLGKLEATYNKKNSILQDAFEGSCRVAGLAFDNENNLWFSNHSSGQPVCVLKTDGNIQCFSIGNVFGGSNYISNMAIDDENHKWFAHSRDGGLLVYNHGTDINNAGDDAYKVLTKDIGNGALASNQVNCLVKDKKGEIWVGTNAGLSIFSSPELIFSGSENSFDSRQIVIQTGLVFSNFLGGENINCITVDGANRKWIGTNNGAWLVSSDGYTVLQNFTTKNSPILDNTILSIGINNNTGEVFFGTLKGMNSFMSDATEATADFGVIDIYPNPVKPSFIGDISIKGLAENVNVKITDINGNLVSETTSNGGFATWNGKNFAGTRVPSGVYLVFAANREGSKSMVGKLLFIN